MATKKTPARKAKAPPKRKANRRGRPSALTAEVKEQIIRAMRAGTYVETAASHAGVSRRVVYKWMKRGREELDRRDLFDEDTAKRQRNTAYRKQMEKEDRTARASEEAYVDFVLSMEKAMADSELAALMVINNAGEGGTVLKRTTKILSDGSEEVTEVLARSEWAASAWRLERRDPRKWGRRVDANVAVTNTADIDSPELRNRLVDSLLRLGANGESLPSIPAPAEEDEDDDD
jgi:transposase